VDSSQGAGPRVSIVIPVYNGSDYLREAVDSALAQTYRNVEVIVVDDGSDDGGKTAAIARSYGDRIRYLAKTNGGVASALNAGIRAMTGAYFSWLSHDDVYCPRKIEVQVARMTAEGRDVVLYGDYELIDGASRVVGTERIPPVRPADFRHALVTRYPINGCTALVPKACFDAAGEFDERLRTTQDYAMWFALSARFDFVHVPEILIRSRVHPGQGSLTLTSLDEKNALYLGFLDRLFDEGSAPSDEKSRAVFFMRAAVVLARRGFLEASARARALSLRSGSALARWGDPLWVWLEARRRGRGLIARHRTFRRPAAALLLFALAAVAALGFAASSPLPPVASDAWSYMALARNVAAGAGFSEDGATPAVYRPPLFAGLLGGWFRVAGSSTAQSAAVFQSLVHALGVAAAFLLFLEIAPSGLWAAAAAFFLAVNPLLVTRVAFVLQEPVVLLATLVAAWASVRLVKAPSPARAALAGAAWGVCTLGKVVCWFAPLLLLGMRLLPPRLRWAWRGREAALLLLGFALVVSPWTVRNFVHFHRFIPVNDQGPGMLEWNVRMARIPGQPSGEAIVAAIDQEHPPDGARRAALWDYARRHLRYFLVDRVVRNAVTFAAPARDWWIAKGYFPPGGDRTRFWILAGLFHLPLYVLLLVRTGQWLKGDVAPAFGFLVVFYWAYWAEHAIIWGDPRFGLAVYPLLVAVAIPPPGAAAVSGVAESAPARGTAGAGAAAAPPG